MECTTTPYVAYWAKFNYVRPEHRESVHSDSPRVPFSLLSFHTHKTKYSEFYFRILTIVKQNVYECLWRRNLTNAGIVQNKHIDRLTRTKDASSISRMLSGDVTRVPLLGTRSDCVLLWIFPLFSVSASLEWRRGRLRRRSWWSLNPGIKNAHHTTSLVASFTAAF